MQTIGDLLSRDLGRNIEEVIKVDQGDEESVYAEITEYVATDKIKEQYHTLLRAIAEAPAEPHEGIGVWVSGFFGSGKSSFAKNLGYVLANRNIRGHRASGLFKSQVDDPRLGDLIDLINIKIPTETILFDVSVDKAVKKNTERVAEIMYTVLLRELDYAEDFDIAELEFELEKEGRLEEFVARCLQNYGIEWRMVRKGAQKMSRASAILHAIDPATYATPDSWSHALHGRTADITVGRFVERAFDLAARRRPGKALVFIIDEVGQYVARSADKIEDLRAVVEQFGKVGKNRLKSKQVVAPTWIVVTSQEKLDEVVSAIGDSRRVDLAKLQDRFKFRVDLAPSDIREVATRRVLAKKDAAVPVIRKLFRESEGLLNAACRLERTSRKTEVTEDDFVQFYPYLPHYVELSIGIMSGIRLQPGAPKHYGGSNRTIIKQAYEMLVSERTALASKPIGTLVTLDRIFELVEGNLSNEKRTDINDIADRFKGDAEDRGWTSRVAKAVCLLEFVRDLPRTEANLAACLVDEVGKPAPLAQVKVALEKLQKAQFVRSTEEGWKLQTAQEKNWDTERRGFLAPKPRDRNEITRQAIQSIFSEPALKAYRYKDYRTFKVGIQVDGSKVGDEGDIALSVFTADDADEFPKRLEGVREESRQPSHKDDIYWVVALTPEIDDLVAQLHASREMVKKYDQMRGQNKITSEETACLQDEKNAVLNSQSRLRDKVVEAFERGHGVFRGVDKDAPSLGKSAGEIVRRWLDHAVPDLYGKLEMGARAIKGTEADEVLKAVDLKALPQVFYSGEKGLNLVVKDGAKFVANPAADVAKEVLDHLNGEFGYGNKETRTGKALEGKFGGIGYGWDRDMIRLILAVLFRAGSIEVSSGGQKFDSYQDPRSRVPFTNNPQFKAALFTPVKPPSLKSLRQAVENYEELTGGTVDVDRSAIAAALKEVAEEELKLLLPVEAQAHANGLPVLDAIAGYKETLNSIKAGTADDCVTVLVGEGASLKEARDRVRKIRDATGGAGLADLRHARLAATEMGTVLAARGQDADLQPKVEELRGLLASPTFHEEMKTIRSSAKAIASAYRVVYTAAHSGRTEVFSAAIEAVKGRPEWGLVPEAMQGPLLSPLSSRACVVPDLPEAGLACRNCSATVSQMESDLAALGGLKGQVVARMLEITTPKESRMERVRVAMFFDGAIDSEESVKDAVKLLQDHLLKLIDEGVKIVVE